MTLIILFQCISISGLGFRRGSYKCVCKDGFYFPEVKAQLKYYNGTFLEEEYEKSSMVSLTDQIQKYVCRFKFARYTHTCFIIPTCSFSSIVSILYTVTYLK